MIKIPPKISTVESLQRRMDEMELDSAIFPSINSSLNDMFLSINDQSQQAQSLKEVAFYGAGKRQKSPQVIVTERDMRMIEMCIKENMIEAANCGIHQKVSNIMRGKGLDGLTVSDSSMTNTSNKFMTMQSVSKTTIGTPDSTRQSPQDWRLGQELFNHGSFRLDALFCQHAYIGCSICSGFGHSKSKCLTNAQLKLITKGQPTFIGIESAALDLLKAKKGVYDFWLYGDLLVYFCSEQRSQQIDEKTAEGRNIQLLCSLFTIEISDLYSKRCLYCDGWGHLGTDKSTVKLGKRTYAPAEAKKEQIGKHIYATYDQHCPTKQSLELAMIGFPNSKSDFVQAMSRAREIVGEQYRKSRDAFKQSTQPNFRLDTSEGVLEYYKSHLVFVNDKTKIQLDEQKPAQYPKDIAAKTQTDRALEFEKKCLTRKGVFMALPETQDGAKLQVDMIHADKDLMKSATLETQKIQPKDKEIIKFNQFQKYWKLYSKAKRAPAFRLGDDTQKNFFPFIVPQDDGKARLPAVKALLLSRLKEKLKEFNGFDEEWVKNIPNDDSLQNFFFTGHENIYPTLAALFVSEQAFLNAMSFYIFLTKKFGTTSLYTKDKILKSLVDVESLKGEYEAGKDKNAIGKDDVPMFTRGAKYFEEILRLHTVKVQKISTYQITKAARLLAQAEKNQKVLDDMVNIQLSNEEQKDNDIAQGAVAEQQNSNEIGISDSNNVKADVQPVQLQQQEVDESMDNQEEPIIQPNLDEVEEVE